jgi:hypothetical protein
MKPTSGTTTIAAAVAAALVLVGACGKATSPSPVSPSSASPGSSSGTVHVDGKIASINANARSLVVASTTVVVPATAALSSSSGQVEFKDLQVEMQIHVVGTLEDNVLKAQEVQVEDHGTPQPQPVPGSENETEFTGSVASVGGACPNLTLSVNGKTVMTSIATSFLKAACSALSARDVVEVKGITQTDGTVLASRVQVDDDAVAEPQPEPEPGDQNETEFKGAVAMMAGSCPALTLTVASRTVRSTASTEFQDGTCGAVKAGVTLEVKGMAASDGSVTASRLKLDK